MRRMLLLVTVVALVAAMMAVTAGTASAKPPAGSADTCPGNFQAMTREDLITQAEGAGIPEEDASARFDLVNKNQDAWMCQKELPGATEPLPSPHGTDYNFIDNQAVGLDKS